MSFVLCVCILIYADPVPGHSAGKFPHRAKRGQVQSICGRIVSKGWERGAAGLVPGGGGRQSKSVQVHHGGLYFTGYANTP